MQDIVILGSTGSIGTQALEIVASHPGHFRVLALAASGSHLDLLARQAVEYEVPLVAAANSSVGELDEAIREAQIHSDKPKVRHHLLTGRAGVEAAAGCVPDGIVLNAIAGISGLHATLRALDSGASLALANKESLVIGGSLVRESLRRPGQIAPVDSEHSAIWQALQSGKHERGLCSPRVTGYSEVARLILTASGGPFRGRSREELENVTVEQALHHPTWDMGPLVTVNSATMFNKGLEIIEASLLFDIDPKDIDVVVHPSSIVHSMVQFRDGATLLQASPPDMKIPIALGLSAPARLREVAPACDWSEPVDWHFEPVDTEVFPAVNLARRAIQASATHPAVMASADEVAVGAFLQGRLPFLGIYEVVSRVVEEHHGKTAPDLTELEATLEWAKQRANELIAER
ncbi:MAG: 1-deoxy-D-xylulose-5-phosphate reductoisomerase [Mobiluncus porci]|uniref:1-deoxy-D-xylulose-5-phosphate reductoisomerase n=1 Tax=Mobiluncus porci TaxID=2652278 RepID=UPI0023EFD911|nr:1-deoxy-D-xylulose-5-phosphate reductoisomerase [Mobiluncus porci]MDD7542167.1 1-deoxy-D-xylulose-5-phosphate reductoisomerase [Mobiluncus porci]MDY5747899.1 1-deoxy-D-xylulose-5-phosphate reductoisomerase [Mobiluncus porci]